MANKVTGRAFIKMNGRLIKSKLDARLINPMSEEREPILGDNGVAGYKVNPVAPAIEASMIHPDVSFDEMKEFSGNVTFETDTGKTYLLHDAWVESVTELNVSDSASAVRFAGIRVEEVS